MVNYLQSNAPHIIYVGLKLALFAQKDIQAICFKVKLKKTKNENSLDTKLIHINHIIISGGEMEEEEDEVFTISQSKTLRSKGVKIHISELSSPIKYVCNLQ